MRFRFINPFIASKLGKYSDSLHPSTLRTSLLGNKNIHTSSMNSGNNYVVTLKSMNQNVKNIEYAVRGPLVIRAVELQKELAAGVKKPFNEVIRANIGDCHAMGQIYITWIRQVLACVVDPTNMESGKYPKDVVDRAKLLLDNCGGKSVGAYSDSAGVEIIRRHCAEFISQRDGFPSNWQDIVITTGASEAVKAVLQLINSTYCDKNPTGVMIPIPQYPLYTATISEYGMYPINYYLDEDNQWSLNIEELRRAFKNSLPNCTPKALVVINPGNPTGSVLTKENIRDIIEFAKENKLLIIADEVYQHNIYAEGASFFSFKKVMSEMGYKLEMASMMSASKGYMGECGLRGGYCEIINLEPDVKKMFLKMLSARLCSSVLGQITMDCIVKPPKPGDPSYDLFINEKEGVLKSLKERAILTADTFNSIPGIRSNRVAGAMYAFPEITLPEKAIEAAQDRNQAPDFFYAMELLETTGICVVPGSGFGQIPNTYHFRTTILPQPDNLKKMMEIFKDFHLKFLEKYK